MKKIIFLLFALLFLPNAAQAAGLMDSPWPVFHGDSKLTGQSPYDTSHVDGTIKWKFKADGQTEISPAIDSEGNIYFVDQKCNLYAVTPEGEEKWKFNAGEPIISKEWGGFGSCAQSSPVIDSDGTVYFLPMTGNFYAVDKNGKEKWRYPIHTFKNAWPSPAIGADGTIYVGSEIYPPPETGKPQEKPASFYAFNPNGTLKWSYATQGSWVNSTPSIADGGTIYTTANDCSHNCDSGVFAMNPNGTLKWIFLPPNGVLEGSVVVGKDGTLYFTAKGEDDPRKANFYAITPEGKEKWKFPLQNGASITPAITPDGKIYFGDWGGIFYALDLNGKELWRVQTPPAFEALSSSPAIGVDGTIYFGTVAKYFYAYTPEGKEKWKIGFDDSWVVSSPAIGKDGTVYFTTVQGELYAIGEGENVQETAASALNQPKNDSGGIPFTFIAIIAFLIFTVALIFAILRKNKIFIIALTVLGLILAAIFAYLYFKSGNQVKPPAVQENTSEQKYSCPDNIYEKTSNNYYVTDNEKQRDLGGKEVDWIRANCKDVKWPGSSQEVKQNNDNSTTNNASSSNPERCPRRVYGAQSSGYYGIYEMKQVDITTDEFFWIKKNCPNTYLIGEGEVGKPIGEQ